VKLDDYLVYPQLPGRGEFCIASVAGEYGYLTGPPDFRSFRPCKLLTPDPIEIHDAIVPPTIRRKLGLMGRFYELYDMDLFEQLLGALPQAGKLAEPGGTQRVARIFASIVPSVPLLVQKEFPAFDFSRILCRELFENMGYSVQVREGAYDFGTDLFVTVGDDLLPRTFAVGVQTFAWKGPASLTDLKGKLKQLLEGWTKNGLDFGVLMTTGQCGPEARDLVAEHNKNNPNRLVRLIDGDRVAQLFLTHFEIRD
jgi:hypothetical protein